MSRSTKNLVFIVDDDPDDREAIRDAFRENKHDHEFVFMENGNKLFDVLSTQFSQTYPAIILLDLNMPGKNGKEILKEIKEDATLRKIPVVIITTSSSEKDRDISYELGANCFVTKPDSYKELLHLTDSIAKLWFTKPAA
ncbi:MAG: response regulator [Chitinophagaceae bacterium]|nr:response regulator [Chitinophagaceae bacterium]